MQIKFIFQFLIAISIADAAKLKDYCKISQENIPCKYKCARASRCGKTGDKYKLLTAAERQEAVDIHNKYRQMVAKGGFSNISLPAASNMNALSYDKECEFFSGCYIKQCVFEHDDAFTADGQGLGQSLYTMMSPTELKLSKDIITRGINSWFREVHQVSSSEAEQMVSSYQLRFETGHFGQMMWAETLYVGCAMMHNLRDSPYHTYDMFCHYRPGGNMPSVKMYSPGGMSCTANKDYPNLCGSIRPLSEDTYEFPAELGGRGDNGGSRMHAEVFYLVVLSVFPLNLIYIIL